MSGRSLREKIYIIGYCSNALMGSKLPSSLEVLKVLFFYLRKVKLNLRESATLVVEEVLIFWRKARIPTRAKHHCIEKLEKLHKQWRMFLKDSGKTSEFHKNKLSNWTELLEDLFDVAHAEALNTIAIEEDKAFLISQRQKGRPGFMYGIDYAEDKKERNTEIRKQEDSKRRDRSNQEINKLNETVQFTSSESDSSFDISGTDTDKFQEPQTDSNPDIAVFQPPTKKFRGAKKIMTPKLAIALDYCKISDRNSVHIISAVLESVNIDVADYIVNRTSIQVARQKLRKERATVLRDKFRLNVLDNICLHWDGKLLPALTGNVKVDRLPIIVSSGESEQLLEVAALHSGTGRDQADALYRSICEWGLQKEIKCLVFDTTAVNTGRHKGTCALIEHDLQRKLMWLPCRHHIYEVVLRGVFEEKFPSHSSPNVVMFEKFKNAWSKINIRNWQPGMQDKVVNDYFKKSKSRVVNFVNTILQGVQPREDYKELLELALLFLGEKLEKSPNSVIIRSPGAYHHARWMGKAIYSLKIYLFRGEFELTEPERIGLRQICIFVVAVYVEAWFSAPLAIQAPYTDLMFLSKLEDFEKIDIGISQVAVKKFSNHLWYLNEETIAFAFFDNNVVDSTKEKMVAALNVKKEKHSNLNRVTMGDQTVSNFISGGLEQFVSSQTKIFFARFKIDISFMTLTPSKWPEQDCYITALKTLKRLRVVNDTAERGVKLIEEYNKLFTKNEEQKQFVLQVVSDYRRRFSNSTKATVCQEL